MHQNAERFQRMLVEREDPRERITEAAVAYEGDQNDDRTVFEAVIAPVARSNGVELTYEEAREAALDGRELTDEELELVAGGAGVFYRKLVSGVLAATLVFGSVPVHAFAQEGGSGGTGAQTEQVLDNAGPSEADQAALNAIESYAPGISDAEIAVPEGIEIDGTDVYYTDAASDLVKNAAIEAGIPYEDDIVVLMAAPSGGESAKEESDVDKGFGVADKTFDYTNKALGFVSKDAQDVLAYGKKFYDLIKSCASGDFEGIFGGVEDFLSLMGVIEGGGEEAGPSNADLMAEMKDLNDMVGAMRNELSSNTRQTYQNRLTSFDNALKVLSTDCKIMEAMYAKAYSLAERRGLLQSEPEEPTLTELPAQPMLAELPAEPTLELPPEPQSAHEVFQSSFTSSEGYNRWADQLDEWERRYGITHTTTWGDWQYAKSLYDQAYDAWKKECMRLKDEYEKAHADWQAECDRINAESEKTYNDWVAECDRISKENDKLQSDYEEALENFRSYGNLGSVLDVLMREEYQKGNANFRGYEQFMTDIRHNFELVCAECSKDATSNPLTAFDSFWDLHFNFKTQGYYLRQAYRTNAEYQLKRAYALLGVYFGFASDPNNDIAARPLSEAMRDALNGMAAIPAGESPEDIDPSNCHVWCNTLEKYITKTNIGYGIRSSANDNRGCPTNLDTANDRQATDFAKRMDGRTLREELELAGLMPKNLGVFNNFVEYKENPSPLQGFQNVIGLALTNKYFGNPRSEETWGSVILNNGNLMKDCHTWSSQPLSNYAKHCHSVMWFDASAE